MQTESLLTLLQLFAGLAFCAPWPDFSYTIKNGQTRLLSNSFGEPGIDATYDYIVVGGGQSGLTAAARLAEDPNLAVAVVEAGSFYEIDTGNKTQVPFYENYFNEAPLTIDWGQYTTPQPQLNNRVIHYSQGKTFGGGTARNGLVYQRATSGAWDLWAANVSDPSWTFDNILPVFQKSCNFTPPNLAKRGGPPIPINESAFVPGGGPLKVSFWGNYLESSPYTRAGLENFGLVENSNIQTGSMLGYAQYPSGLDPDAQIRDSSETSFGQYAIGNTDLKIYPNTLAKRIIFDGKKAIGVALETATQPFTLTATKEVVLAAGAFRTPQLLMVSGVGPSSQLEPLGIPIISELQGIGTNMWDQPGIGVTFVANVTTQHQLYVNETYLEESKAQYLQNQSGPLTVFSGNYLGWEKYPEHYRDHMSPATLADLDSFPDDWPDMQYVPYPAGPPTNDTRNLYNINLTLQKATSRGKVTINSTDTADNPIIDVAWLTTETDQQVSIAAVRRARELFNGMGITGGPELEPGEQATSDEDILAYLRNTTLTFHHAASTCKMGTDEDPTAVTDSKGRLRGGISGIRVVDASVMPLLPPGQPMGLIYMVAEKIAADILAGN